MFKVLCLTRSFPIKLHGCCVSILVLQCSRKPRTTAFKHSSAAEAHNPNGFNGLTWGWHENRFKSRALYLQKKLHLYHAVCMTLFTSVIRDSFWFHDFWIQFCHAGKTLSLLVKQKGTPRIRAGFLQPAWPSNKERQRVATSPVMKSKLIEHIAWMLSRNAHVGGETFSHNKLTKLKRCVSRVHFALYRHSGNLKVWPTYWHNMHILEV